MINATHHQEVEIEIDLEDYIDDNSDECIDYLVDNHGEVVMEKLLDNRIDEVIDEMKSRGVTDTPDYSIDELDEHFAFNTKLSQPNSDYRNKLVKVFLKHFKDEVVVELFKSI